MAKPYLIVTSEKVSKEYLDYLDRQNISWIACVKEHVDLARATEILAEQFGVERTLLHSRFQCFQTAIISYKISTMIIALQFFNIPLKDFRQFFPVNHTIFINKNKISLLLLQTYKNSILLVY